MILSGKIFTKVGFELLDSAKFSLGSLPQECAFSVQTEQTKSSKKSAKRIQTYIQQSLLQAKIQDGPGESIEYVCPDGTKNYYTKIESDSNPGTFSHVFQRELNFGSEKPQEFDASEQKVKLYTGSCLLGLHGASGRTQLGIKGSLCDPNYMEKSFLINPIVRLTAKSQLQPYELQWMLTRRSFYTMVPQVDKVYQNYPFCPYLLNARDLIGTGSMKSDLFEEWKNLLSNKVVQLKNLEEEVSQVEIAAIDALSEFLEPISNLKLTLTEFTNLLSESDPWWNTFLESSPPESFSDIGKASYIKGYFDFIANESKDSKLVFLEEPEEENILIKFKQAQKEGLFDFEESGQVTAFYVLFQQFVVDHQKKLYKYYESDFKDQANELMKQMIARATPELSKSQVEAIEKEIKLNNKRPIRMFERIRSAQAYA